jgi:hypothetical protein
MSSSRGRNQLREECLGLGERRPIAHGREKVTRFGKWQAGAGLGKDNHAPPVAE